MKVQETKFNIGDSVWLDYEAACEDYNTPEDVERFIYLYEYKIESIIIKIANDESECYECYIVRGRETPVEYLWSEAEVRQYASEHMGK